MMLLMCWILIHPLVVGIDGVADAGGRWRLAGGTRTSDVEGTAPRAPLLGIVLPEIRTDVDNRLVSAPLPTPLSPVLASAGDDLLPGKLGISSSLAEYEILMGDESAALAFVQGTSNMSGTREDR